MDTPIAMNSPVIQSLWIGKELSTLERLCICSFIRNGHDFHLYTYEKVDNVPDETIVMDANEIIEKEEIFTYNNGSYAGFADWFRWELLYAKGNFWVDMDVICLRPFLFDTDIIFGLEREVASVGVLSFPVKHNISNTMKYICKYPNMLLSYDSIKIRLKKIRRRNNNDSRDKIAWGEAGGPVGFTRILHYLNLLREDKDYNYFYPVHFTCWHSVFDGSISEEILSGCNTFSIHLWNEMIRRACLDKNQTFPENSLFEKLKKRYLIK